MKTKNEIIVTEEIRNERLERYQERIEDKPRDQNQLLVNKGKAVLVIGGKHDACTRIEGYVKFPDTDYFTSIDLVDVVFCMLPKGRLIILLKDQTFFLGYKKNNTEGCFIMVHAACECEDILIVATSDGIPLIAREDPFDEDHFNEAVYRNMEYIFKKMDIRLREVPDVEAEEVEDEWE